MNDQAITYYAKKYFGHLRLDYAEQCVRAILRQEGFIK